MTTWQSCDCYLLPVNGPFLCLISFTYGFAPLSFFSLFFYFPVYFSILAFSSFFAFFLFHSLLLFFLFIGKASLEPADYPRVLGYKKVRSLLQTTHQICFDWTYVYAGLAPFIFLFYYNILFAQSQPASPYSRQIGVIV